MESLTSLTKTIRRYCVMATTAAGSGHLTSSLSAADLMTTLMFGGFFRFDPYNPDLPNNDRLIFSKGHASPLFYALWTAAGLIPVEELTSFRKFGSRLEGHPSMHFPYTEVPTGSLGQGLSVGVGMALNGKYLDKLPYKTFVLLGDSEMAEGSNWEAMQLAAHYKLDNLVGIIDVNRLGQSGETMHGYDVDDYVKKVEAFGWHALQVDGHDIGAIQKVFTAIREGQTSTDKPVMVIAKTVKGKGISFLEDADGWHGKVLTTDEAEKALLEIGGDDAPPHTTIEEPENLSPARYTPSQEPSEKQESSEDYDEPLAPREAYGHGLVEMHPDFPEMVVLDAEVSNSTYAEAFKKAYPERFFEMYIAEQNMVGVALGLAARGKLPYVSTFGAFFTRAHDQLRMSAYAGFPIVCVGSHVGVSIGEDGVSQMGLEDIALFRSLHGSVVVSPCDHVSCEKLARELATHRGISYMRTSRSKTVPLYGPDDHFAIGGSKTLHTSPKDEVTLVATGVTVQEAREAYEVLKKENISVRVIDAYSLKPIDVEALQKAARETKAIITVEDHYAQGGLADAVRGALGGRPVRVYSLAVEKLPHSGTPEELRAHESINADACVEKVHAIMRGM